MEYDAKQHAESTMVESATSEVPRWQVLETQHALLQQESTDFYSTLEEPENSALQIALEEAARMLDAQFPDGNHSFEEITDFLVSKDAPAAVLEFAAKDNDLSNRLAAVEKALNEEAIQKARYYGEKARELEQTIDYNKLVDSLAQGDNDIDYYVRNYITHRLDLQNSDRFDTMRLTESAWLNAQRAFSAITQAGYVIEGIVIDELDPPSSEDVSATLEVNRNYIKQVLDLHATYKDYRLRSPQWITMSRLDRWLDRNVIEQPGSSLTNPELDRALLYRIFREFEQMPEIEKTLDINSQAYQEYAKHVRTVDVHQALAQLKIEGNLDDLPFKLTVEDLKKHLAEMTIPLVLQSLKQLEFNDIPPVKGKPVLGQQSYDPELSGSKIIINHVFLKELCEEYKQDPDYDDKQSELTVKDEFYQILTHELAHALHETLPYVDLSRWEQIREVDPTHVSRYVKSKHDENHVNRAMEDFADSAAYFTYRPFDLQVLTPIRLAELGRLHRTYMPNHEAVTRKVNTGLLLGALMLKKGSADYRDMLLKTINDEA